MLATSVAIPPVATFWRAIGLVADRDSTLADAPSRGIDAVLFDRDGTLIYDVPYNGDPEAVVPKDGAGAAVGRLREAGLRIGVVSNQSGIGRGRLTADQVDAVNRRVEELVGRLDAVVYCPHSPDQACDCRKPAPGLIFEAARRLDTDPSRCVVIGDILSDIRAGERAGARSILVPDEATARCDLDAAAHVASSLAEAADMVLAWRAG